MKRRGMRHILHFFVRWRFIFQRQGLWTWGIVKEPPFYGIGLGLWLTGFEDNEW